jgi:hypothetical protein
VNTVSIPGLENPIPEIIIYTSQYCQFCREAILFFKIRACLIWIWMYYGNRRLQEEMLARGGIATPLIVVGKRIFHAFEKMQIEEELNRYEG